MGAPGISSELVSSRAACSCSRYCGRFGGVGGCGVCDIGSPRRFSGNIELPYQFRGFSEYYMYISVVAFWLVS